ncbi:HD-GYP domain-containing protein [Candidatus Zixiibacteriota bacterium]
MVTIQQPDRNTANYLPVYLDALRLDSILDFDLFLEVQGNMVLYREKNLPFTEKYRQNLLEHRVTQLYVPLSARKKYQRYIESSLDKIIADENIPEPSKAQIIYDTSKNLVQEVFENPRLGENIRRSKKMVEHTISYILRGREAFIHMLQITSFDYYTYTHSINVCTFSIALARRLGMESQAILHELGIGALLHDIGKNRIPPRVLKKRGSLSHVEYELVKKHPTWGAEILRETNLIPPKSYYPVLQHQERMDGTGYPHALKSSQIHLYGRITAICDTFDALTTQRTYKKASDSFAALKLMKSISMEFDTEILNEFIRLMGPEQQTTSRKFKNIPREILVRT